MTKFLKRVSKPALAYHQYVGVKLPGVLFLSGFMSDMSGTKAMALEKWCRKTARSYVRFDYSGIGLSEKCMLDLQCWIDDAADIMGALTTGPQVLVGSSMGAFIMLQLGMRFPERVCGMLAVAPAFHFVDGVRSWQRDVTSRGGFRHMTSPYGEWKVPDCFFNMETLNKIELDFDRLSLPCPMHVLHGMKDDVVPWKLVVDLVASWKEHVLAITLQKNGDHRLSQDSDIRLLLHLMRLLVEN